MSKFRNMTSGPDAVISLASMFRSSLGVRHGYKCIVDGDKELFLRSASLMLQNLDIEHPVGQYLVLTCQSFHKRHGNGVKTLLFLIGSLMEMAVSQQEKAIPVCDIVSAIQEGVKQCQKVIEEVKLPLSDVLQSCDQGKVFPSTTEQSPSETTTGFPTPAIPKPALAMVQLSLKEKITEPEEDVDWFFDDNPILQGHDSNSHIKVQGHSIPDVFENRTRDTDFVMTLAVTHETLSDDSDFDDCFEDIPEVRKTGTSDSCNTPSSRLRVADTSNTSLAKSFDISKPSNNVNSGLLESQGQRRQESGTGHVDNNFSEEYGSRESTVGKSSNEGQHTIRSQQVTGQGILGPPDLDKNSSHRQVLSETFAIKLKELLHQKMRNKKQEHTVIYNSSRHFRSVESTVDMLKQGKFSTDQKNLTHEFMYPCTHDHQHQSVTSQGQCLKDQGHFFHNQSCYKEESLNKQPYRQEIPETTHSVSLEKKLGDILGKARSQKMSGAMLQSRHFIEIGQCINDIETVQRLETKGQYKMDEKVFTKDQTLTDKSDFAVSASQSSEVKIQEQNMLAQGQNSKVQNQEKGMLSQSFESLEVKSGDSGSVSTGDLHVLSGFDLMNRRSVCGVSGEIDWWVGLKSVARSLSHCDEDMMDILVEAAMSQWRTEGCQDLRSQARLTSDLLYCCVTLGPFPTSRLVSGVIMAAEVANLPLVHQYKDRPLNAIMINGDIKPNYHHIGYKQTLEVQKTMTALDFLHTDKQSSWLNNVEDILHQFSVMCLLVRGSVCDEVKVMCETLGVIAIENVPYKALQVMCAATVTSMTTYLTEVNKTSVCSSISLDIYTDKWMMGCEANFVNVACNNTPVQTCVITHPTRGGGDLMEQDYWRCANILSSLLSSRYVLPGAGKTEELCSQALSSKSGKNRVCGMCDKSLSTNTNSVLNRNDFSSVGGLDIYDKKESTAVIFDDYKSKMESMQTACDFVATVLLCDSFIVTGVDQTQGLHIDTTNLVTGQFVDVIL
ncbi:uncharacterized protein LOC132547841 [Ylistrum balloti]|uniref:uncharacterized protein LOC132547841 n=1 Tax=Ylistrum balloti TaxID=509963 RepID=UPI002905E9AF|nr:uncharacterized protein LOC132547841 [Ylistrum balloti]